MVVKRIWLVIVAIALLAGCAYDTTITPIPEQEERAIGFATGTNAITRADGQAENSSAEDAYGLMNYHDNFSVWGYKYTNTTFNPVFESQEVAWDGSLWDYTPHRYWDKTAKYYNFYACAPAEDKGWTLTIPNPMEESSRLTFSYSNYTADGKSLAQSTEEPTSSENSLFATDESCNKADLMIAHDVIKHNENHQNNPVSFEFDHILSRLNIALMRSEEMETAGAVVKLKELTIFNLQEKGSFKEVVDGLSSAELKAGTNKRWTASNKNTTGVGVAFDDDGKVVTGSNPYLGTATPTNNIGDDYLYVYQGLVVPQEINYVASDIDIKGTGAKNEAYMKVVYTIDGETFTRYYNLAETFGNVNAPYEVNGRTAYKTDKSQTSASYAWSADEETFYANATTGTTAYTNAEVAYQVEEQTTGGTTTTTYWLNYFAADTETDETKKKKQIDRASTGVFYEYGCSDDAHKLSTQPKVVVVIEDKALVPVLRKEISNLCDMTFCEGWQYNLKMTIGPKAIRFNVSIEAWGKGTDQVFAIE